MLLPWGGVDIRENPARGSENEYEVDFFRDPNSILDLERICYTRGTRIRDAAVHGFIKVADKYYNSTIPIYDDYFYFLCKRFVKEITAFTKRDSAHYVGYILKELSLEEYRASAKKMLLDFLRNMPSREFLVMDNLMSISEPNEEILKGYFGDYKIVYVWCDPRDIYARARLQPGNDWIPVQPETFVKYYKWTLTKFLESKSDKVLCVNFDEFCNNFNEVSKKIMDFIGLKEENHVNKFKFFDPKVSIHNTQVYPKIQNQEAVNYIFNNLREFCYIPK